MKQQSLASQAAFEKYGRKSRRELFLDEMEKVVPWSALEALVRPHYAKGGWPTREVLVFLFSYHDSSGAPSMTRFTVMGGKRRCPEWHDPGVFPLIANPGPPTAGPAGSQPRHKPRFVTLYVKRKGIPTPNSFRIKYGLPRGRGGTPGGDSTVRCLSARSTTSCPGTWPSPALPITLK